ncbi:PHA/PHB synthase family protein [Simiduia agarivorans]|uniref:Poly-beta-hydroxybutyrate polymerase n=1 Tax=Simiduia agarivorans (strain DSM 21679 / JCM 13881 / BCRC 17597 / SA1) TaxID=1117647 RepID=R9S5W0_SIMAS|nr:class I poly(R)-hydroxyalkanoic acid synthase [Simiduia agarivorans]AGN11374.1 poly-beta-hydroxybutyrate polymerase [Simiduia agarivorans SA1 = DSM 21679]
MNVNFSELFTQLTEQALKQMQAHIGQYPPSPAFSPKPDVDIDQWLRLQTEALQQHTALCGALAQALQKQEHMPELVPDDAGDHRFADADWHQQPLYSFLRQTYLTNARLLTQQLDAVSFDNAEEEKHWRFYARQLINAMAPGNFAWSNPEVMRETVAQQGENLQKGLTNLLNDLQKSPLEALRISQVDDSGFALGKNVAATPGQVVYRNALMELIQYAPRTEQVYKTPLLIVPPFINKYYILDLNEKKSLVAWLVDQGFTVFMVSWANPESQHRDLGFEHYMQEGLLTALEVVCEICGTEKVHAAGYCVGGTLLTATQAWLRAQGREALASITLLTTLLDFSEPGDLGHYLNSPMLESLEPLVESRGLLDGRVLATSFNFLRENDLYWPTFINNYLHGQTPPAFDLLYWNSDSTNLTEQIFHSYVKRFYRDNPFVNNGGLMVGDTLCHPRMIDTPAYVLGAAKDHIVLWQAAYASARLLTGPTRFVQAGSGHIAGVINPPALQKYGYCAGPLSRADSLKPEDWLQQATSHAGSWWPDWAEWLTGQCNEKTPAREPGNGLFPPLTEAPGRYVLKRL